MHFLTSQQQNNRKNEKEPGVLSSCSKTSLFRLGMNNAG